MVDGGLVAVMVMYMVVMVIVVPLLVMERRRDLVAGRVAAAAAAAAITAVATVVGGRRVHVVVHLSFRSAVSQSDREVDDMRDGIYSCEKNRILNLSIDEQGRVGERRSDRMRER